MPGFGECAMTPNMLSRRDRLQKDPASHVVEATYVVATKLNYPFWRALEAFVAAKSARHGDQNGIGIQHVSTSKKDIRELSVVCTEVYLHDAVRLTQEEAEAHHQQHRALVFDSQVPYFRLTVRGTLDRNINISSASVDAIFGKVSKHLAGLQNVSRWTLSSATTLSVKKSYDEKVDEESPLPELSLAVQLRDYQRQSLRWMISQEQQASSVFSPFTLTLAEPGAKPVYYSPFTTTLSLAPPEDIRGGFLCEEMGLGKTVEILGLINAQQPTVPVGTPIAAGASQATQSMLTPPVVHGGTLIIAPTSLVGQVTATCCRCCNEFLSLFVATRLCHYSRQSPPSLVGARDPEQDDEPAFGAGVLRQQTPQQA